MKVWRALHENKNHGTVVTSKPKITTGFIL